MSPELLERIFTQQALLGVAPMLVLAIGALLMMTVDMVPRLEPTRRFIFAASCVVAFVYEARLFGSPQGELFEGTFASTPATAAWGMVFLASTLVAWACGLHYYRREKPFLAEYDVLMICACIGMMLMAGSRDLLVFFLGLELLSIPLYALAGFRRARNDSVEAGLKYFLLGAFSAGLYLYGASLVYASTGSLALAEIAAAEGSPLLWIGVGLLAGSLFFKLSVFPFHLWVPDVYQGSPTPVTAFMATGTKAAAVAFVLQLGGLLPPTAVPTVLFIALATIALGNLSALVQGDLKRMLAWSGVAHAGTLLLVLAGDLAGDPSDGATSAAIYYMAAYVFTAGGAFGLIAMLEAKGEQFTKLDSLRGLARRRPGVAAAMALFMLSLGGIPGTGGFLGKYLVFSVMVRAELIVPAIVGALLSVIALGYYLRVVVVMYMQPEVEGREAPVGAPLSATLTAGACSAMVVVLGVLPGWFLSQLG